MEKEQDVENVGKKTDQDRPAAEEPRNEGSSFCYIAGLKHVLSSLALHKYISIQTVFSYNVQLDGIY